MNFHRNFICNNQNINKLDVLQWVNGWLKCGISTPVTLLINKMEANINTHHNVDESQVHAKVKKRANLKKVHTWWFHVYIILKMTTNIENKSVVVRGWGKGMQLQGCGVREFLYGYRRVLYLDVVMQIYVLYRSYIW